jgi:polar amino acid transport system ATP-binding protein
MSTASFKPNLHSNPDPLSRAVEPVISAARSGAIRSMARSSPVPLCADHVVGPWAASRLSSLSRRAAATPAIDEMQPTNQGYTDKPIPAVEARQVVKRFGGIEVLRGIDLTVMPGEVVCLIGPSGSGKSTFLRCINHLEKIDGGSLSVDGEFVGYRQIGRKLYELEERSIAAKRAEIGMVFQRFNLFAHKTALENVIEAPMIVKRERRRQAVARGEALLARVGLGHRLHAYPAELSGGQQQRVAIARALAMSPRLMLFDEPTSALDPELVSEVLDVMRDLVDEGMTMIVVTHEMSFAREMGHKIVMMDEGLVVESGTPSRVFAAPDHPRTRAFLSKLL